MTLDDLLLTGKRLEERHAYALRRLGEETEATEKARQRLLDVTEAQSVIQQVAQGVQQSAHDALAGVVSKCLEAVFDRPYRFRIEFDRKRGKTEARLTFVRDGLTLDSPQDMAGGGVIDVAAFALKAAALCSRSPAVRRLLVLDEPFKFVSEEYRYRVRRMLEALIQEMGLQLVLVTHNPEYQIGTVIELGGE